jgi:DNA replication ATP-dependent helicase/nuclease Dna2
VDSQPQGPASTTTEARQRRRCFLCAYSDVACDLASIEGRLARVWVGAGREGALWALLTGDDGTEAAITLPGHARRLVRELAALPPAQLNTLRVRVYHLLRSHEDDSQPTRRQRLRTTPVSAVILEPDTLLNITDINNAEYCVRQYPLRRMAPSPPTAATLRGTIIHSAFKELLKGGHGARGDYLERALQAQATELALHELSYADVALDAELHMQALWSWYEGERGNLWRDALDVRAETFLLAPEVGLKGRLDFLLQDQRGGVLLELKTGRANGSLPKRQHRWQVYGYQTLLAARRPDAGAHPGATLLYSATPGRAEGHGLRLIPRELHAVLELRNLLALVHVTGAVPAPPGAAKCGRCALRSECLRASQLLGWEAPPSDEQPPPVPPADAAWFRTYYELLRHEALAAEAESVALWRRSPNERRELGTALGDLQPLGEPVATESGEWEYTLACENTSELREGDQILLSDGDPVTGAVVSGTVLRVDHRGITVWTPERIAHPRLLDRYGSDIVQLRTARNLWRWLEAEPRLRELVAGTRAPAFDAAPPLDNLPAQLNAEQRRAIERALAARDFLIIQGPPGTGKTKVVAEIARQAMARGERVLIAAFTNQAVDNVLLRLAEEGVTDFVRLGHALSVAPALQWSRLADRALARSGGAGGATPPDPALLRQTLRAARLVATTTATWSAERYDGAGETLRFDLAIMDEASQLTVPALLGALRFARRFVLVGDEKQLPPLVVSEAAARGGLGQSLFASLLERWGEGASVALRQQYRMHPAICAFPSVTFYGGRLEAAGPALTATLDVSARAAHPLWPILCPERPLVFVHVPAAPHAPAHGKASAAQADVVRTLVRALFELGVQAEAIGVIAPYRAQVAAIRQRLERLVADGTRRIVVDTVDRFQGAERPVLLFSFGGRVPGEMHAHGVDFLADAHRLNVALTRAQRKLILVGDREWLAQEPLLAQLIAHCEGLYGGRGGMVTARSS